MNTWKEGINALTKEFKFETFKKAIDFINKVADIAESQNHHPEIINIYNRVILKLSTHDAGDVVTQKDRELAEAIDQLTKTDNTV